MLSITTYQLTNSCAYLCMIKLFKIYSQSREELPRSHTYGKICWKLMDAERRRVTLPEMWPLLGCSGLCGWHTPVRMWAALTEPRVLLITEEHKKEDMERVERWGWGPLRGKRGVVGGCNHCTSYKCMKLSKNKRYSFKKLNLPKGFSMSLFCSGLVQQACCPHLSKIKRYWLQLVDKS